MKITLEFEGIEEAHKALKWREYLVCLQRMDGFLRSQEKWNDKLTEKEFEYIDMVRSHLLNICSEEGIQLYD
jgi:hypothetical protein